MVRRLLRAVRAVCEARGAAGGSESRTGAKGAEDRELGELLWEAEAGDGGATDNDLGREGWGAYSGAREAFLKAEWVNGRKSAVQLTLTPRARTLNFIRAFYSFRPAWL